MGFRVLFDVRDAAAIRGQYLALLQGLMILFFPSFDRISCLEYLDGNVDLS